MSLSTVATSAYVADVAKKEQIGASMGALSSIMDIGQSAGPVVTGIIVAVAGYPSGFLRDSFSLLLLPGSLYCPCEAMRLRSQGKPSGRARCRYRDSGFPVEYSRYLARITIRTGNGTTPCTHLHF